MCRIGTPSPKFSGQGKRKREKKGKEKK
jgi:hypothetical protein